MLELTGMVKLPRLSIEEARNRAERATRFLAADPRVKLVFLFGSAVDPSRKTVEDVDLAILTDLPLGLYELLDLKADVSRAGGGDVDLVLLNDASIVLAHEVTVTGRCLHVDPPELEAEFVARTNMKYLDFKWYLDRQWEILGERLEARRSGLPD
jgi:predicted nucleotidyltransferase